MDFESHHVSGLQILLGQATIKIKVYQAYMYAHVMDSGEKKLSQSAKLGHFLV